MSDDRPQRDPRLDFLRGVAVALVLFGHCISGVYGSTTAAPLWLAASYTVFSSLHVPLFMFVSGYLAPDAPGLKWVRDRGMRLLVPFLAWASLQWAVWHRPEGIVWLRRVLAWPGRTNTLWFLYVLFELCVLYAALRGDERLIAVGAVACLLIPAPANAKWGLSWVLLYFPIFAAGRFAASRRLSARWWAIPLAGALLWALWTSPGANLQWGMPAWAVALDARTAAWAVDPVRVLVAALRVALGLSLTAGAFYLARRVRHGGWLGANTLGVYAAHALFIPVWATGRGLIGLAGAFAITLAGSAVAVFLARRWWVTSFVLLGSGRLPRFGFRRAEAQEG